MLLFAKTSSDLLSVAAALCLRIRHRPRSMTIDLQGHCVCDTMLDVVEVTMDAEGCLSLCTCKDKTCRGRSVVRIDLPVSSASSRDPALSVCPPCPVCGGEMKMVPLSSEAMEFIPEVARPDAISQTIFSMTVFEPADGRDSSADRGPLSEATPQESGKTGLEEKEKPEKKILNEQDVAAILELKVEDVKRLIKKKRLRFIKLPGRKRGFTEEIIDEFIRNESGLPPRQGPGIEKLMAPRTPQGISLEESRALLRRLRKKDRA